MERDKSATTANRADLRLLKQQLVYWRYTATVGDSAAMIKVKIFGERNTGTNFLRALVAINFSNRFLLPSPMIRVLGVLARNETHREWIRDTYFRLTYHSNFGWKHAMAPDPASVAKWGHDVAFLTITKNPYAWLLSLFKRPYHAQNRYGSFREFLTSPWPVVRRENYDGTAFANPTAMWCEKNRSYQRLAGVARHCLNLRYEDCLANSQPVLERLAELGLSRRTEQWAVVQESTKGDNKTFTDYQDYYLQEQWKQQLDAETISIINHSLDPGVVESCGYKLLSPADAATAGGGRPA